MFPSNLLLDRENLFLYVYKYVDQKQRLMAAMLAVKRVSRCAPEVNHTESIARRSTEACKWRDPL